MERLFGSIPSVLSSLGPNAVADEALAFAAWARCAGEVLRARTAPLEFFENRLVIATQDETWRRHLEDLSPQMLASLNGILGQGTVRFIEFRIDEHAVMNALQGSDQPAAAPAPEVALSLVSAAEAIADEGLRGRFLDAAAKYLAKQDGKGKRGKVKK